MLPSRSLPNSLGFWDNSSYQGLGHSYLLIPGGE